MLFGFDGFDLSKSWATPLHFSTWEEADEYKHAHLPELLRLCEYQVTVYEHPTLDRADAALDYPAYTKLPSRKVGDTRRLSAVEGTKLSYQFHLNKPVTSARLINPQEESIDLKVHANQPLAELLPLTLTHNQIWKLEFTDSAGRNNKLFPRIEISVYANKPPKIRIASPRGDQQVSPLEEVDFTAEIAP